MSVIWGRGKARIFFARHLDNPNQLESPHEFSFFAHAVFAPKSWSSEATLHKNELICPSSGNSVWSVDRKKEPLCRDTIRERRDAICIRAGVASPVVGIHGELRLRHRADSNIPESRPNDARTELNFPSKPFVTLAQRVLAITNKMFAKESNNARVEVPVKSRSVEAGRIGTRARQVRRELWRARRQKSVVTGWDDGNVRPEVCGDRFRRARFALLIRCQFQSETITPFPVAGHS